MWIADVAAGFEFLHAWRSEEVPEGLVHRDIKPSNIRVDRNGRAILLDFGQARSVGAAADMTDRVGTYLWRAPELLGHADRVDGQRCDNWGLGAVAHWILVGQPPALDGAAASRERIAASATVRQLGDPRAVARHVSALLEFSPDDRIGHLGPWRDQLLEISRRRKDRVHRVRVGAAGFVAIGVAGLLALTTWGSDADRRAPSVAIEGTTVTRSKPVVTAPPETSTPVTSTTLDPALALPTSICSNCRTVTSALAAAVIVQWLAGAGLGLQDPVAAYGALQSRADAEWFIGTTETAARIGITEGAPPALRDQLLALNAIRVRLEHGSCMSLYPGNILGDPATSAALQRSSSLGEFFTTFERLRSNG